MTERTLHVFEGMALPLDAVTKVLAFMGMRGGGKTYAAGVYVEELLGANVQTVVVDQVGNWWGLRVDANGRDSSAFDVPVIGGLRGDIPLSHEAGALIADAIADTGRSVILDVSQFSHAQRKRFLSDFGDRLWTRKKAQSSPSPLHIVLEECQLVVPQYVGKDDARMVGAWEIIIRLGRNYGIGVSLLSQRPQSVNKEALTQAEVVVAFQVNGSQERKALREWLVEQGGNVDLVNELPGLQVGDAYVWSPAWLRIFRKLHVRKKRTLDASATPKVGEKRVLRELKPLDLGALREAMSAAENLAIQEDPRALRRRIADLERQLATQSRPPASPPVEKLVPVISDSAAAALERSVARLEGLASEVAKSAQDLASPFRQTLAALRPRPQQMPRAAPPPRPPSAPTPHAGHANPASEQDGEPLGRGPERMLAALAMVGTHFLTAHQLGCLSDYSPTSSTYRNYRSALQTRGLAATRGHGVEITEEGLAHVGGEPANVVTTPEGWRSLFREKLEGGPRALFDVLLARPGQVLTDDELATAATSPTSPEGYSASSSTYRNYRSRLTTLELAERVDGGLRLAPTPFGP